MGSGIDKDLKDHVFEDFFYLQGRQGHRAGADGDAEDPERAWRKHYLQIQTRPGNHVCCDFSPER